MKLKVSGWGNSHGVRLSSSLMKHLNIQGGDEVEVKLTTNGAEILKSGNAIDHLVSVKQDVLKSLLSRTDEVSRVKDPYSTNDVAYVVIDINPCSPLIREVPIGTENSFNTLADAKEAARQILQSSINEAQKSLFELRQVGVDAINYIAL